MRNILCAVDFSECSRVALEAAIVQTQEHGPTRLHLLHVVSAPYRSELTDESWKTFAPATEEDIKSLHDMVDRAKAKGCAEVEHQHLTGRPWEVIVDRATALGCDLIVMGTHGSGGLRRALLGSVAEQVVRHATCSVLVARGKPAA
jgi:nucleotide-binding universal stress UspA family protein